MRLLYVIHQFFPDCHSGTEQYCLAMAKEARRRGDEVTVLSLHWDHERDEPPIKLFEQPYDDFRVLRLNHWQGLNPNDVLRDYDNPHLEDWFQGVLDDVRPEVVHLFHLRQLGSNLVPVARRFGARVVASLTDFWFLCPRFTLLRGDGALCDGPPDEGAGCVACHHPELVGVEPAEGVAERTGESPQRLRALLDRKQVQLERLELVDAIVAPSRFLAGMFVDNGLPPERLQVLPYGLEPGRIVPLPAERPRQPLRLGFCGVLSPWKGLHLLVEAVRDSAAEVTLSVHGRTEEPMFQDYIDGVLQRAAGDERITFAGPYGEGEAPKVFADIDVLVVPSTWYENTPFVVLEAFAAGVPVIASDLGGLSEAVEDGINGLLFRPGEAQSLRTAIELLANDPVLCAGLRPAPPPSIADNYDHFAKIYRG